MNKTIISVIIPTYNRANFLKYALEALCQQTLSSELFEVILVDDGGEDNTEELVESYKPRINIKYYWQEDLGFRAGRARNIGTMMSEGKYIVYIDAGITLARTSLAEHLRIHTNYSHPVAVIGYVHGFGINNDVLNPIVPSLDYKDVDSIFTTLEKHNIVDVRQKQYDELGDNIISWPAPFDIFFTCHVSVDRNEVIKVGLFDESLNNWGAEDIDLAIRLFLNNNIFVMDKGIRSFHWPHKTLSLEEIINGAPKRIKFLHEKYNLWQTRIYVKRFIDKTLNTDKLSLNSMIKNLTHKDYI